MINSLLTLQTSVVDAVKQTFFCLVSIDFCTVFINGIFYKSKKIKLVKYNRAIEKGNM